MFLPFFLILHHIDAFYGDQMHQIYPKTIVQSS